MITNDLIALPRAVVEALVDPEKRPYIGLVYRRPDIERECLYCATWETYDNRQTLDGWNHDPDCPVRIVQDALKETS